MILCQQKNKRETLPLMPSGIKYRYLLNSYTECQTYFSKFYTLFKTIYDRSFPFTRVKTRYRYRLPWLTEGLKNSIKVKNKLYQTSVKHPTSYNFSKYKYYKNKLSSILKKEEKMYYQSEILSNKNNLSKVWAIIKQVINRKKVKKIMKNSCMIIE